MAAGVALEKVDMVVALSPAGPLARLEHARAELEHAATVDEVKDIRDKAEALRLYAKQAKLGLEAQNLCAEVKLRAERRAGEMLAADLRAPGNPQWSQSDTIGLADFDLSKSQSSRWQSVARIPADEFESYVGAFTTPGAARELTSSGALKLAKQLAAAEDRTSPRTVAWSARDRDMPTSFSTLVADPPWQYGNTATRGAARDHYSTMPIGDLLALDVNNLEGIDGNHDLRVPVADNAHLYLWVTNGFLREGLELVEAWGFVYKTCITWCKPQIGLGNYFRNSTEHILFGVRGSLPTRRSNVPTWFTADRTRHSAKPECFYDLVESSSDGPYLEMFSRSRRLNGDWHVWGFQA